MSDDPLDPRATVRFELEMLQALKDVAKYRGLNTAAAIREGVTFYVTLFGPWPGFVFRENRSFTIQFVNQPALELLGYKFEELFGSSMIDLYDEKTRQELQIVSEFMQAGGVRNVRVGVRKRNGETVPMRLFAQREVKAVGIPRVYAAWRHV